MFYQLFCGPYSREELYSSNFEEMKLEQVLLLFTVDRGLYYKISKILLYFKYYYYFKIFEIATFHRCACSTISSPDRTIKTCMKMKILMNLYTGILHKYSSRVRKLRNVNYSD